MINSRETGKITYLSLMEKVKVNCWRTGVRRAIKIIYY